MIKKLRLHNFRTYLNTELDLERRHLIVGRNNSGKSNLLQAIRFLGATASLSLDEAALAWIPGSVSELKNWAFKSNRVDLEIECEICFGEEHLVYTYGLSLDVTPQPGQASSTTLGLRVSQEQLVCDGGPFKKAHLIDNDGHEARLLHEEQVGHQSEPYSPKTLSPPNATMLSKLYDLETNRRAIHFRKFLCMFFYCTPSPPQMRTGWREASQPAGLGHYCDNLATVLFYLKNQDERRYRRIIERVNKVEPGLEAINFIPTPDQSFVPFISLRGRDSGASWFGLSDGTLRVLALAYLIEEANRISRDGTWPAPVIMIEELENGIYANVLRDILEECENYAPEAQFLFTSHSPLFIDLFDGNREAVTILRRDQERTVTQRVSAAETTMHDERITLAEQYFSEMI